MTAVEIIERDKERAEKTFIGPIVSLKNKLPPQLIAPAIVEGSRKRARKHITTYKEVFGDSQEDLTAGIKRRKSGGIL
jgi:hypothetical protein